MELNAERETWDAWGPEHSDSTLARRLARFVRGEERMTLKERRGFL